MNGDQEIAAIRRRGRNVRWRGRNVGRIIRPGERCRFAFDRRADSLRVSLGWLIVVWWGRG